MKTIALIAHDQKKEEMLEFVGNHLDVLKQFHLVATRTTGQLQAMLSFLYNRCCVCWQDIALKLFCTDFPVYVKTIYHITNFIQPVSINIISAAHIGYFLI